MTTFSDYAEYDDDHLITEKEAIQIVMGELGISRKQARRLIEAHILAGDLEWVTEH